MASRQRIRLKQTLVDEEGPVSKLSPITRLFPTALRNYGACLVENSGRFTFYAKDAHTTGLHLSDDKGNTFIGAHPKTPLPEGLTKWQIVMEALGNDHELIPIVINPGDDELLPRTAEFNIAKLEVVELAEVP